MIGTVLGYLLLVSVPSIVMAFMLFVHWFVCHRHLSSSILRIFQEKPMFLIPRGEPRGGGEEIMFLSADRSILRGVYFRTHLPRRGVVLFGLEYGSGRWSFLPYCEELIASGFDVFTFEPRNQGDSASIPGYEPLQWLTRYEVEDTHAAIDYLRHRHDADASGIGYFGISKGASAGLSAASLDPWVRCVVTDGAFGTVSTMTPYMRKWISLYSDRHVIQNLLPGWFLSSIAHVCMARIERMRNVEFVHVEDTLHHLRCPLLMIHGSGDTYIRTTMAQQLFRRCRGPKEFWLVESARHNQSLHVAGDEYHRRVSQFFKLHLPLEPDAVVRFNSVAVNAVPTEAELEIA